MLTIYSSNTQAPQVWHSGSSVVSEPIWLDLVDPTEDERSEAARLLGMALPTRDQTSAIELSSRLRSSETALRVNIPSFVRAEGERGPSTPLGFLLTPKVLATIRYAGSLAFDDVAISLGSADAPTSADGVFIGLIESIVDVGADRMEIVAADLSRLSQEVFLDDRNQRHLLRRALFQVGAMQRQISQIRSALLGVSRVVTYLCDAAPSWMDAKLHTQFKSVHADIGSLGEFDQQLSERLQFLLDAVLGFINNDQNEIMKLLTIVSVATVPPMILAGIWGMNFKSIPEYDWPHGYAFALSMIGLSMVLPLIWFKLKKWM